MSLYVHLYGTCCLVDNVFNQFIGLFYTALYEGYGLFVSYDWHDVNWMGEPRAVANEHTLWGVGAIHFGLHLIVVLGLGCFECIIVLDAGHILDVRVGIWTFDLYNHLLLSVVDEAVWGCRIKFDGVVLTA